MRRMMLAATVAFLACGPEDWGMDGFGPGSDEGYGGTGSGPCIVGTWSTSTCGGSGTQNYVFRSDGTGYFKNPDCNGVCEPIVFHFNYDADGDSCTLNYTSSDTIYCSGYGEQTPAKPTRSDTFTYECSATTLVTSTSLGTVTLTRAGSSGGSSTGGGTTGGGTTGGGTSTTGQALFWTRSATLGGSYIDVYVEDSYVGRLSTYNTDAPSCGDSVAPTITRDPGTYSFNAQGEDGSTWSGSITITAGGCNRMEFTG